MMEVLAPTNNAGHEDQLQRVISSGALLPFDPLLIDFVDAVSKTVLLDPVMRRLPEMAAVAHWMRKAHVVELCRTFERMRGGRLWLARGLCLHFAPSNVDSIFLYSWFISLLLGNGNVVRLSRRRGEQVDLLLAKVDSILDNEKYAAVRDRSLLLSFDHDDDFVRRLSEVCQVRVLWGGDESVRRIRSIPLNPLAIEVAFANRFSLAVMSANKVREAGADETANLAAKFHRDAYWFDQMACSSPRLVIWIGDSSACVSAQSLFWQALAAEVLTRKTEYPQIVGLNKLVTAYASAATGIADRVWPDVTGPISRVHLETNASAEFRKVECGGGFFFETERGTIHQIADILTERDQTLAYYGFEREELKELALSLPPRAVDRIVPIGSALDFNTVWDGSNLLQVFTREVDLQ
jgi:hypothetical protein